MISPHEKISPEIVDSLLSKLRHHALAGNEAKKFLSLLEEEIIGAKQGQKTEYEKVVTKLKEILELYTDNTFDLRQADFEILNKLDTMN